LFSLRDALGIPWRVGPYGTGASGGFMWDFSIGGAMGLMARTLPFIGLRMAVYFAITLAYLLATGAGAGIGFGVGALGDTGFQAGATFWGGAIGLGIVGAVMYWARE